MAAQAMLFGFGSPLADGAFRGIQRTELGGGAWVEYVPGWLAGHETLYDSLRDGTDWQAAQRVMFERLVAVPRLTATIPRDGPGHPALDEAASALGGRFGVDFDSISLAWYRDGRDSVAFHGDRLGPLKDDSVVAIVSLGGPRRFLMRPVAGGSSLSWNFGWGDLLVMGGNAQRTWEHGVPKTVDAAPRMAVMFRHSAPIVRSVSGPRALPRG